MTTDAVRRSMRANRDGTKPEVRLQQALRAAFPSRTRFNYRGLAGRPDVLVTGDRPVAVFMDGCFWHACPEHHKRPRKNAEFWDAKFQANAERDARVNRTLNMAGIAVYRVWECRIRDDAGLRDVVRMIVRAAARRGVKGAIVKLQPRKKA